MSEKTIFFSYSRDDSAFVLNLAKELRADGASVWLDQLDIKPGTRWDKSIEDALDTSQTVLVILSKTSVESTNVMDEVSYALEEGKTVLPVLLEECDIPFRLRRLQFADFSQSHDKGKATLTAALGLDSKEATKPTPAPEKPAPVPEKPEEKTVAPPPEKKETVAKTPVTEDKKPKSKLPLYIIGGVVLILGVMFATGVFSSDKPEKKEEEQKEFVTDEIDTNGLDVKEVQPDFDDIGKEMKLLAAGIKFTTGKPDVKESEKEINRLVEILDKFPGLKINIACHTDSVGRDGLNMALSQRRADFIKQLMVNKGIAASRINSQGFGESIPIASNKTREGRALNTRVEISISK